ncbi:hypothetical protein RUM44_007786 [Polyplax serrata]|uniref:Uncharacterized protein n=1 Tax=Polyplax serrata TaxID=468196 RepID=A0ABR1B784_POLSC
MYILRVKEKKSKHKSSSEESTNKSTPFSEEDSDVEALAKLYEEKYGTCNDYAELGEGYDEEDSFIDNSDAVNDLVPSGIQTEFGGFYINRGKLNFVKEDNSSSSTSEDVDKFLAHNRLKTRKIIYSDDDDGNEDKESCKSQSNNHGGSSAVGGNHANSIISSNSTNNSGHNSNSHCNNNNNGSLHSNIVKSRKRSGEYQHKSKKIRKTATPKIPEHLLNKKPFPGSLEYRKTIKEIKKNKLKSAGPDKKSTVTNSLVNSTSNNSNNNNNNHYHQNNNSDNNPGNNASTVNTSCNNNCGEDDIEKEGAVTKKKSGTVKELIKERDGASEVIEAVATGADIDDKQYSSSSESSDSSSSDSDSDSSEDTSTEKEKEKEKPPQKSADDVQHKSSVFNGFVAKDATAKSFAHLSDDLKELVARIMEISKEEKTKFFNSKLNTILLSLDERLRELPMAERNSVLEHVAEVLQMKKDNITKRTKKLLVLQEESKMSAPLRKLKECVTAMMPLLESNYFNEYTKAAGTRSIDPSALPQRKFPWNDELRHHLREVVQYRKNCYYIIRPRKESLIDYIRNFMETKVKSFWPKDWMTVDILLEEAQVTSPRPPEEKSKTIAKILGTQNQPSASKKTPTNPSLSNSANRKVIPSGPQSSVPANATSSRKPASGSSKNMEVKSILIPRKTPQGNISSGNTSSKNNAATPVSSLQNNGRGNRLQVTLNRLNVQEYLDRLSGSQTSISRNQSQQQVSPNRSQHSLSPNRLVKATSPNSVLNPMAGRPNSTKNTSPNSANKSSVRSNSNSQSVLKTIEIHSNPVSGSKTSPNAVTISPVNESVFKDMTPSAEVLNLTKNSSVYISKVKECSETKTGRSNSPSIGIPLPSGITISPTNATPSTFLAKPQKPSAERNSDVKINVSITKQDSGAGQAKEKRDMSIVNVKREGPLQNIPDCISVTSKVVPSERHKYEHVRKRALQEYHHQQQQPPERHKASEEKKMRTDGNLLSDMELREDKFDEKNFSKIFDSVIAKTSETVRQSEVSISHGKLDRYGSMDGGMTVPMVKNTAAVNVSQLKNNSSRIRDVVRPPKEKSYYPDTVETDKRFDDADERSQNMKEQRVQMEMDRVMQNLVELSREKNAEYEYESQHMGLKPPSFQEALHKMFK